MLYSFNIQPVNQAKAAHLDSYMKALGLPENSLGQLETVVQKLACIQNTHNIELQQLHHVIFCSDHGVYDRSHQSSLSNLSSSDHVQRILKQQAPIAKACKLHHVDLTVIDCGLSSAEIEPSPHFISRRIASGTRDLSMMSAMTAEELETAVTIGSQYASLKMAEGAKVLSFGAQGLGNTTSAAAICIALLDLTPESAVTNRNRHDPILNRDKVDVLTQAIELHRAHLTDGWKVIQHLGGFEIAAIMGAMAATAELNGMFLVDGFACSAALLALHSLYPNIKEYALFTHESSHTAQHAIMKHLGEKPLLNLNIALGEGTGSVLAWPLIVTAASYAN